MPEGELMLMAVMLQSVYYYYDIKITGVFIGATFGSEMGRGPPHHWTKIEISYTFCFPKCDISSHFLHITIAEDRATCHANE